MIMRLDQFLDFFCLLKRARCFELYLELDNGKSIGLFLQKMRTENIKINTLKTIKNKLPGEFSTAMVNIEVKHYKFRGNVIDEIRNLEYIHYVEEL